MYLYIQLENILRLFEAMKWILRKCIRIVKGTSNLTSTKYVTFVIDAYTDIRIKCFLYKIDMIKMRCKDFFLYLWQTKTVHCRIAIEIIPFVYIRF